MRERAHQKLAGNAPREVRRYAPILFVSWLKSLCENCELGTSAAEEVAEKIGFARDSFFGVLVFPPLPPPFLFFGRPFRCFCSPAETLLPRPTPLELASPCVSSCRPWPPTEITSPPFSSRALSLAARCCPAWPSQTLSPPTCVSVD